MLVNRQGKGKDSQGQEVDTEKIQYDHANKNLGLLDVSRREKQGRA